MDPLDGWFSECAGRAAGSPAPPTSGDPSESKRLGRWRPRSAILGAEASSVCRPGQTAVRVGSRPWALAPAGADERYHLSEGARKAEGPLGLV